MSMKVQADARSLPFRSGVFDQIVTSPPWNSPRVLHAAIPEMARVLKDDGHMIVMNRRRTELRDKQGRVRSQGPPMPQTGPGLTYPSTRPLSAALLIDRGALVLDPFAGVGGVVAGAALAGAYGVGADIEHRALTWQ
jgi:tRNA G10  N-methylase Trm11